MIPVIFAWHRCRQQQLGRAPGAEWFSFAKLREHLPHLHFSLCHSMLDTTMNKMEEEGQPGLNEEQVNTVCHRDSFEEEQMVSRS